MKGTKRISGSPTVVALKNMIVVMAPALRDALQRTDLAAVVFASASAVRGFVKLGGGTALPAITIGPRTTAVAREAGFVVLAEAEAQDVKEMVAAVVRAIPVEVRKDA